MTDHAARIRSLERAQRQQEIENEPARLKSVQAELGKRFESVQEQGYTDRETARLIAEAEALQLSIGNRKAWRTAFWTLMSPLILIAVVGWLAILQL